MSLTMRLMGSEDMSFANSIRDQAGWNQTPQDWQDLLNCPDSLCFLAVESAGPCSIGP